MIIRIKTIILASIVFSLSFFDATNIYMQLEKDAQTSVKYSIEESKDKKSKSESSMTDEMNRIYASLTYMEKNFNNFKDTQQFYNNIYSNTLFKPPIYS